MSCPHAFQRGQLVQLGNHFGIVVWANPHPIGGAPGPVYQRNFDPKVAVRPGDGPGRGPGALAGGLPGRVMRLTFPLPLPT
jgi:hypothetical protein